MWLVARLKRNLQAVFKAQLFRTLMTHRSFYAISSRVSWQTEKQLLFVDSFWRSEQFIESFVIHATPWGFKRHRLHWTESIGQYSQSLCSWYLHASAAYAIWSHHDHLGSPKSQYLHGLSKRFAFLIEKFPERHVNERNCNLNLVLTCDLQRPDCICRCTWKSLNIRMLSYFTDRVRYHA